MSDRPYDWAEELVLFADEDEGMRVEGDWPGWAYALLVIAVVVIAAAFAIALLAAASHG